MGILLKKKSIESSQAIDNLSSFAALIDEVGYMEPEVEKINKKIKELQAQLTPYKDLLLKLQEELDKVDAEDDDKFVENGINFRLEVGAKGNSRAVRDMLKTIEYMGEDVFLQVCKVDMKEIDNYLTKPQRDEVLETTRTKRSIKIQKR